MTEVFFLNFWFPFLLIFTRVAGFISLLPFFGWQGIPVLVRVFFSFVLAVLLALNWEGQLVLPRTDLEFIILLGRELLVGVLLGFFVYLFLSVFLMAGQFMDHKAGLMMGGTFDPLFGGQVTIIGQFFYLLAVVFYLTINGHHLLFLSFWESLTVMPLAGPFVPAATILEVVQTFASIFMLAFQIAAPVVVVLWIMDLALGFVAKTVPQIHVFIVGLPLKVALVLGLFMLLLPLLGVVMSDVFDMLSRDLILIIRSMQ